jgi:hypothetical protein
MGTFFSPQEYKRMNMLKLFFSRSKMFIYSFLSFTEQSQQFMYFTVKNYYSLHAANNLCAI